MTSFIAGTWSLLNYSKEMITGARNMKLRVHRLLQPGQIELSEKDQQRLMNLQRRVDCLVEPLNFLLGWSKRRDSCGLQVIINTQELLFEAYNFVGTFTPQDGGSSGGKGLAANFDSDRLEYYLKELEFACTAVGMVVSIVHATDSMRQARSSEDGVSGGVSAAALLRSSWRIQEMHGRSGDLCACPGRLYIAGPSGHPSGTSCTDTVPRVTDGEWSLRFPLATLKIVASLDVKTGRRGYSMVVESHLPLGQREGVSADGQKPLIFPIEVAFDTCLITTADIKLPEPDSAGQLSELGIDSRVLVWGMAMNSPTLEPQSEETSDEFVVLTKPPSKSLRSIQKRSQSTNPPTQWCGERYAFEFDFCGMSSRATEAEVTLTPIDAIYLSRLCAIDDGDQQSPMHDVPDMPLVSRHLLISDEHLTALLEKGMHS